jgi:methionyl-tRNA formyltransferase
MEVVPALDAGAMISKGIVTITELDTAQTLHDALAKTGADLMVQAMEKLSKNGALDSTSQDESLVTYAEKLQKSEATIDWNKSADAISKQVRAFNPFPVATAILNGEVCRIWMATKKPGKGRAGEVMATNETIDVACGEDILCIHELQLPGGKRLKAHEFLTGRQLTVGTQFE